MQNKIAKNIKIKSKKFKNNLKSKKKLNIKYLKKYTYFFGKNYAVEEYSKKSILGNKGTSLTEMSKIKIPVPPGFIISSKICAKFLKKSNNLPNFVKNRILEEINKLENLTGLKFGDKNNPLLLSIRSSSIVSMPGMMETILNIGLNNETVKGLGKETKNLQFAYKLYKKYIETYSKTILGIDLIKFTKTSYIKKTLLNFNKKEDLSLKELKKIIQNYTKLLDKLSNKNFPQNINQQLWNSINAIFKSWNIKRAIKYRNLNDISNSYAPAVIIQLMVFGNKGKNCATGVIFTRNPSNGENQIFGEYIMNAQGEDIVSGTKTPYPINIKSKNKWLQKKNSLEEAIPVIYKELKHISRKLELYYKDMQDIEFTIENYKCWILQTRSGKRTATAAIKIAIDMQNEGILDERQVLSNLTPEIIEKTLHSKINPKAKKFLLTKGLPASPGAVFGNITFSSTEAEKIAKNTKVILIRDETNTEDIAGIYICSGILTSQGGMTSHAAVIARGIGKPCITGAFEVIINKKSKIAKIKNHILKEGDTITIDGSNGEVYLGKINTIKSKLDKYLKKLIIISEYHAKLKVLANAETIKDIVIAKNFNAEGIGLCRTEHMFFQKNRINIFRAMILSKDKNERLKILGKLLLYQKKDFYKLLKTMNGLPLIIRLLDPPLHEFLPKDSNQKLSNLTKLMSISCQDIKKTSNALKEINPMLGHRGCRLAITYPEIYQMQIQAILRAAYKCIKDGIDINPKIMIPLITNKLEFIKIKNMINNIIQKLEKELKLKFKYKIGSMIELPAAIINSGEISKEADFISFGTNDLTQTCLGISRDDASNFLKTYINKNIFNNNPFVTIQEQSVGRLLKIAIQKSRKYNPKIKIGICGEHAGDPKSIKFFNKMQVNYISCSPFRVPIAKISTAKYNF